jgi:hypothetical protein
MNPTDLYRAQLNQKRNLVDSILKEGWRRRLKSSLIMKSEYERGHAPSKAVRTGPLICWPRIDAAAEGGSAGVLDILSCHFRPF